MMNTNPNPPPESANVKWGEAPEVSPRETTEDFMRAFTQAMTRGDVEGLVGLFAPEGEWVLMATGERFREPDRIRRLAARTVDAGRTPGGIGVEPTSAFANPEGTKFCWEYVRTEAVPPQGQEPPSDEKFNLPVLLMGEIRHGKIIRIHEYFDRLSLVEA